MAQPADEGTGHDRKPCELEISVSHNVTTFEAGLHLINHVDRQLYDNQLTELPEWIGYLVKLEFL